MSITLAEFSNDVIKYMHLALTIDIKVVSEDNEVLWTINSSKTQDRVKTAKSLFGILPADITLEDAQKERLETL